MKKLISLLLFIAIWFATVWSFVNAEENTYKYLNKSIIEKLDKKIDSIKGNKTRSLILLIGKVDKIIKSEKNETKKALYTELNAYLKLKKKSFEVKVVDETADWKTYKNDKYGFEFKYPSDISFVWEKEETFKDDKGWESKRISLMVNWWEQWNNQEFPFMGVTIWSKETYNDLIKNDATRTWSLNNSWLSIAKEKGNQVYEFTFAHQDWPDKYLNFEKSDNYNKLLSTFKLVDLDITGNLKTYKNDKYGFEFNYPSDIKFTEVVEEKNWLTSIIRFNVDTISKKWWNWDWKFDILVVSISSKELLTQEYSERGIEFDLKRIKNGNYYQFSWPQDIPEDWISKNVKFNEILSSFKLTESDETANLKTYKNDKYGFEFNYPSYINFIDIKVEREWTDDMAIRFYVKTKDKNWPDNWMFDICVVSIVKKELVIERKKKGELYLIESNFENNWYYYSIVHSYQASPDDWNDSMSEIASILKSSFKLIEN